MKGLFWPVGKGLIIWVCIFLFGCGASQRGYLNTSCLDVPRTEIFHLSKHDLPFSEGKAIIYISDLGRNFSDEWKGYLLNAVFQAFSQQRVFKDLKIGGMFTSRPIRILRQQEADFLVLIKGAEVLSPTKIAPGHLALYLQVIEVKSGDLLLSILGEIDLCPEYPKDYVIFLSKGSFPGKDPYYLRRVFFTLARGLALAIKRNTTHPVFEKPIFEDLRDEEYPTF